MNKTIQHAKWLCCSIFRDNSTPVSIHGWAGGLAGTDWSHACQHHWDNIFMVSATKQPLFRAGKYKYATTLETYY